MTRATLQQFAETMADVFGSETGTMRREIDGDIASIRDEVNGLRSLVRTIFEPRNKTDGT